MNIRMATINDCEQISKLHFLSYQEAGKGKLPDPYLNKLTMERFLLNWQSRLTDKSILTVVAEQESNIIGFATIIHFNLANDLKKEKAELNFFYIHVDHLRKKIGTHLALYLGKILTENGYNFISGWALKDDNRSNGFYSFLGAEVTGNKNTWLPLGTTSETYPDGTFADLNHYAVNDLNKALSLLNYHMKPNKEESTHQDSRNFMSPNFDSSTTAKPVVAIKAVTKIPSFWKNRNKGTRETPLSHGNHEDIFTSASEKENVWKRKDIDTLQCVGARERLINKINEYYIKNEKTRYKQIINLGSGFDIRAYKKNAENQKGKKNSKIYAEIKYFEIDRKHILDEKEKIFNAAQVDKNAIYVGMDYIKENFTEKLKNAGADLNAPTLIIWEGNWMYLEDEDVKTTLDKIKNEFANVTIVFDYVNSALLKKYSQQFNIWKKPKSGIDNIEKFASEYGMKIEIQKTSHDLLIEYNVDDKPAEDLNYHSVCAMTNK